MLRDVSYDQYEPEEVEEMMGKLETTITETADGPQLDRLVEWLEEKRMTPANTPGDRGWESAFTVVLHHIREMQQAGGRLD